MTTKVCASTIQTLTVVTGFNAAAAGLAPDTQTMITNIRKDLLAELASFEQALKDPSLDTDARPALQMARDQAARDVNKFDKMMKEVPHGFMLVPVLYSKIDAKQKQIAYREYHSLVRENFMKFLVKNHKQELRALGICEHGIRRMSQGRSPSDKDGNPYSINVDHIIERGGGGLRTLQKGIDLDLPGIETQTLLINHIGNFILLPEQIHEFKNDLNKLQRYGGIPLNTSKWLLMMVPEARSGLSAYVAPPQPAGHPLAGLFLRTDAEVEKIQKLAKQIRYLVSDLKDLCKIQAVAETLQKVEDTRLAQSQHSFRGVKTPLSDIFNQEMAKHTQENHILKTYIYPSLSETTMKLRDLFQLIARFGKTYEHYQAVVQLYKHPDIQELRRIFAKIPHPEVVTFCGECKSYDVLLQNLGEKLPFRPGPKR